MDSFTLMNSKRSHDDISSSPSSASLIEQSIITTNTTSEYVKPKIKKRKIFNNHVISRNNHGILRFDDRRVPDILIKQAHGTKPKVDDIFDIIYGKGDLTIIPPKSSTKLTLSSLEAQNYFTTVMKNHTVVMLLFNGTDMNIPASFDVLKTAYDLEDYHDKETRYLAVSPYYEEDNNRFGYPILLDKDGSISRFLKLLDPLGGAIYPLTSVLVFNSVGSEQIRIRLGYDCNALYDLSEENNLQSVLLNVLRYLNH